MVNKRMNWIGVDGIDLPRDDIGSGPFVFISRHDDLSIRMILTGLYGCRASQGIESVRLYVHGHGL